MPRRALAIRAFCVLPLLYAYATLRDLSASRSMLKAGGSVKISRGEVRSLMIVGLSVMWSNRLLRSLVARVKQRPFNPIALSVG